MADEEAFGRKVKRKRSKSTSQMSVKQSVPKDKHFKSKYRVKGVGMLSEKKKWKLLQEYKKLKKTEVLTSNTSVGENEEGKEEPILMPKRNGKRKDKQALNVFTKAEDKFNKQNKERQQQIKEKVEEKRKQKLKFEENLKQRRETYKKLNKRTKKGQPVMANQIEHLLSRIQAQI